MPDRAQGEGSRVTAPGHAQEPPGCPFSFLCSSSKDKSKAVLQVSVWELWALPWGRLCALGRPQTTGWCGVPWQLQTLDMWGPVLPHGALTLPRLLCPLQQKYVRCSVRAQIRHLRRVLCHRLGLPLQHVSVGGGGGVGAGGCELRLMAQPCPQVQILFNGEALPDHMTMKQLWLSRWFGKVGVEVGPCSKGGEGRGLRPRSREVSSQG